MALTKAGTEQEKSWLAILLAWVAGFVDAVGFLTLFHLFTAQMSGNLTAMGADIGLASWHDAVLRAFPIPMFALGVGAGILVLELAARRGVRSGVALGLTFEALLLVAFMVAGTVLIHAGALRGRSNAAFYALGSLAALAMGLQTASIQRVSGRIVYTTFLTGMLTNFSEDCVAYLFWRHDAAHGGPPQRGRRWERVAVRRLLLLAAILAAYAAGAALGGFGDAQWSLAALLAPLAALACVIALDLVHPIHPPDSEDVVATIH